MEKINGKHLKEEEKPEVIYIFDPLCGWCYGFSPVMQKIYDEFKSDYDFLVLSGGMITGDRVGPIGLVAPYIKEAYKSVEQTTGVKFGEKFLNEILAKGEAVFDSALPARALATFRLFKPHESLAFASQLQKAIYYDGINLYHDESYGQIAERFEIDSSSFIQKMKEPQIEEIVNNEFEMVAGMGVRAFPSVVLRKGEELTLISTGYKDYEGMRDCLKEESR
jgi:putative protein-disulfide isomerase